MSAVPPEADKPLQRSEMTQRAHKAAVSRCNKPQLYSITSSARVSSIGGKVRPSTLAVFRLTTSTNFVGSCTGRSAGLRPLRILSMNVAASRRAPIGRRNTTSNLPPSRNPHWVQS